MVTLTIHLVRSAKTRLSLSHHTRTTLRDQAANNYCRPAPARQHPVHVRLTVRTTDHINDMLQHCNIDAAMLEHVVDVVHVRLAVRTSDYIDTPWLIKCTSKTVISIPISATVIDHLATPRPNLTIPATDIDHLAVSLPMTTISVIDITHPADYNSNLNIHQQNFISFVKSTNKLSFYFTVISPLFSSLFFWLSLLTRLTVK